MSEKLREAIYWLLLLVSASAIMWTDLNPLLLWEPYVRWINTPHNYVLYWWILVSFGLAATHELWGKLLYPRGRP